MEFYHLSIIIYLPIRWSQGIQNRTFGWGISKTVNEIMYDPDMALSGTDLLTRLQYIDPTFLLLKAQALIQAYSLNSFIGTEEQDFGKSLFPAFIH